MDMIIRSVSIAPTVRQLRRASVQPVAEVAPVTLDVPARAVPVQAQVQTPVETTAQVQEHIPMTQAFVAAHAPVMQGEDLEQRRAREQQEQKELQELRERTEQEAYALGLEKGQKAAKEEAARYIQQLSSLTTELSKAKLLAAQQAEDGIVALVYEACCKVLGSTALTKDGIAALVTQSLSAFREDSGLLVRLHPQDLAALQPDMAGIDGTGSLRWQEDPAIALGGCVVEGASGTLDARLETQLDSLRTALLTTRKNKNLSKGSD